ncbi:MAG: hypothetical protein V4731_05760 [Pseudomonadota bacterium]
MSNDKSLEEARAKVEAALAPKFSNAPAPITPVTGRHAARTPSDEKPSNLVPVDWTFWLNMRTVKLWQACALVVEIEPDQLIHSPTAWMVPHAGPIFKETSFPNLATKARYDKALRLAESAVSYMNGPIYPQGTPQPGNQAEKDVLLTQVVAQFLIWKWEDVPEQLRELSAAARHELAPPQTNDLRQENRIAALSPMAAPASKQRLQEEQILQLLSTQGYEAKKLAMRTPGKPGPKAEIRTLALNDATLFTASSFEKAWERLRSEGAIAGAE